MLTLDLCFCYVSFHHQKTTGRQRWIFARIRAHPGQRSIVGSSTSAIDVRHSSLLINLFSESYPRTFVIEYIIICQGNAMFGACSDMKFSQWHLSISSFRRSDWMVLTWSKSSFLALMQFVPLSDTIFARFPPVEPSFDVKQLWVRSSRVNKLSGFEFVSPDTWTDAHTDSQFMPKLEIAD